MIHSVTDEMDEGIVDEIDHVAVDLGILSYRNEVDHDLPLPSQVTYQPGDLTNRGLERNHPDGHGQVLHLPNDLTRMVYLSLKLRGIS